MKSRILPFVLSGVLCAATAAVLYHASQRHPGTTRRTSLSAEAGNNSSLHGAGGLSAVASRAAVKAGASPRLVESYGKLPLAFEANAGQTDGQVKFISRGSGYTMFLTGDSAVLTLRAGKPKAAGNQREKVKGQKAKVEVPGRALLPSSASIFRGATNNEPLTTYGLSI